MRFAIRALKRLGERELRVLNSIERGMARYFYVPVEEISRLSGYGADMLEVVLKRLNAEGLVQRRRGAYVGYALTSRGYDCLALNVFSKRGVVSSISASPIGIGKESEVYVGLSPSGKKLAVKVHRVGRVSFRQIRKLRSYVGDRRHISWLYQSRLAAKNEWEALRMLFPRRILVPRPIDWNRHIVITDYYEGVELYRVPPLSDPGEVLERIIEQVRQAYDEAGIVHGDLSEYNVLVLPGDQILLFDWPQWVSKNYPSSTLYLRRDIANVLKFFNRKYNLKINIEKRTIEILGRLGVVWV